MRAVGYVANTRQTPNPATAQTFAWNSNLTPDAGSWGDLAALSNAYSETPQDPAEKIVRYCRDFGHRLVAIFGIQGGTDALYAEWATQRAELNQTEPPVNLFEHEYQDKQFAQLLQSLAGPQGHPALVVIPDASHLADDLETLVERLIIIRRTGSETRCADPELPDPLQNGEELLGLQGDPAWLRKRTRAKIMQKAAQGKVLGRTPYGYRCNSNEMLEPIPQEARIVQRIFRSYVGEPETEQAETHLTAEPIGMRLIAQRLTQDRIPTRSGKAWSPPTISIILRNRVYIGTYSRYGFLVTRNHQPIIGRALFRKVQDALALKQLTKQRADPQPPFLLAGILKCQHCGHAVPGLTRKRTWKRNDQSTVSKIYRYYDFYECPLRKQSDTQCPAWRADELDSRVREQIAEWDDVLVRRIDPDTGWNSPDQILEKAQKEFLDQIITVSAGRADLEHLEPYIERIKLIKDRSEEQTSSKTKNPRRIAALIDATQSADPTTARQALTSLVQQVTITKETVKIAPRTKTL